MTGVAWMPEDYKGNALLRNDPYLAQMFTAEQLERLVVTSLHQRWELVNFINAADFDSDEDTDGFDFLVWQRGFGTTGTALPSDGDANTDTDVDREPAFDALDDTAFDDGPVLVGLFDLVPDLHLLGFLA